MKTHTHLVTHIHTHLLRRGRPRSRASTEMPLIIRPVESLFSISTRIPTSHAPSALGLASCQLQRLTDGRAVRLIQSWGAGLQSSIAPLAQRGGGAFRRTGGEKKLKRRPERTTRILLLIPVLWLAEFFVTQQSIANQSVRGIKDDGTTV